MRAVNSDIAILVPNSLRFGRRINHNTNTTLTTTLTSTRPLIESALLRFVLVTRNSRQIELRRFRSNWRADVFISSPRRGSHRVREPQLPAAAPIAQRTPSADCNTETIGDNNTEASILYLKCQICMRPECPSTSTCVYVSIRVCHCANRIEFEPRSREPEAEAATREVARFETQRHVLRAARFVSLINCGFRVSNFLVDDAALF